MKKTVSILLAALLSMSLLAGCTGDQGNVSQTTNGEVNGTNDPSDRATDAIRDDITDPTRTTGSTDATISGGNSSAGTNNGTEPNAGTATDGDMGMDNGTGTGTTGTGAAQG